MDYIEKENNNLKQKKLKSIILQEYIRIFWVLLIVDIPLLLVLVHLAKAELGTSAFALSAILGIILAILRFIVKYIICIAYPIKIYSSNKNELNSISSKFKKNIYTFFIILPILITVLLFFRVPISNYLYKAKYQTGKNSYTVTSEKYKNPMDFYNELSERNLLYNEKTSTIMDKLNENHNSFNYLSINGNNIKQKSYAKSLMFGINDGTFYDEIDGYDIITESTQKSYPVYIYNAILTSPSQNEELQYAALGRYSVNNEDYGDYSPASMDYYIECKILYVNEDIYALIGLGQSRDVEKNFDSYDDPFWDDIYPYYMIISEKKNITTFYNNKYYPNGAIADHKSYIQMKPNSNLESWENIYPIKKVKKIDIDTINSVAKELQDGILKESIENHYKSN